MLWLVLEATSPQTVPGRLTVLMRMAVPRRTIAARGGDIYGGAHRRSPNLIGEHLGERSRALPVALRVQLDQVALAALGQTVRSCRWPMRAFSRNSLPSTTYYHRRRPWAWESAKIVSYAKSPPASGKRTTEPACAILMSSGQFGHTPRFRSVASACAESVGLQLIGRLFAPGSCAVLRRRRPCTNVLVHCSKHPRRA
jgi:hypothetical protein